MRQNLIALLASISVMAIASGSLAQEQDQEAIANQAGTVAETAGNTGGNVGQIAGDRIEQALAPNELGGTTTNTSTNVDVDMDGYIKKGSDPLADVGDKTIGAGDLALKSRGYEGGLAAQGIDTSQIKSATTFNGVMPEVASSMISDVMGQATASFK